MIVEAVNVSTRLALCSGGGLGDICSFLDADGDETDEAENAVVAIVHWRDGGYSPVVLSDFEQRAVS
jgi:hypothetical protein